MKASELHECRAVQGFPKLPYVGVYEGLTENPAQPYTHLS